MRGRRPPFAVRLWSSSFRGKTVGVGELAKSYFDIDSFLPEQSKPKKPAEHEQLGGDPEQLHPSGLPSATQKLPSE